MSVNVSLLVHLLRTIWIFKIFLSVIFHFLWAYRIVLAFCVSAGSFLRLLLFYFSLFSVLCRIFPQSHSSAVLSSWAGCLNPFLSSMARTWEKIYSSPFPHFWYSSPLITSFLETLNQLIILKIILLNIHFPQILLNSFPFLNVLIIIALKNHNFFFHYFTLYGTHTWKS